MDRFHQMQVFVAVAESEGFAAGARRLQLSAPAVTRAIAGLEDDLGVKLLQRTTRSMRLTEAGQRYLEDARRILIELAEADEAAVGNTGEPRGNLALTAPVIFGNVFVTPVIVKGMVMELWIELDDHPALKEIEIENIWIELVENAFELAYP